MWDDSARTDEVSEPDPIPVEEPVWDPDEIEADLAAAPSWRRKSVMWIAAVVVASMISVPVWNVLQRSEPPIAGNGLEICGFDYCDVFAAVRDAGYDSELIQLANTYIAEEEARALTELLVDELGEPPVVVEVVDQLPGATAGRYIDGARLIQLERPVRIWTVVHEAAHTAAGGHAEDFQETLIELLDRMDPAGPVG